MNDERNNMTKQFESDATADLPTAGSLPWMTVEQLAGIMHAGVGTMASVSYYPEGCITCKRAKRWHAEIYPDGEPTDTIKPEVGALAANADIQAGSEGLAHLVGYGDPMPYAGASGSLVPMMAQAVANAADAATVLLFGNDQQKQEVSAWMERNRQQGIRT